MAWYEILSFCGIPVAITGFFVWLIEHRIQKREKEKEAQKAIEKRQEEERKAEEKREAEEKEKYREDLLLMNLQSIRSVIVLSTATAKAVQRIPDAKCNGDMTNALKHVAEVQEDQKDFLLKLGIHSISV